MGQQLTTSPTFWYPVSPLAEWLTITPIPSTRYRPDGPTEIPGLGAKAADRLGRDPEVAVAAALIDGTGSSVDLSETVHRGYGAAAVAPLLTRYPGSQAVYATYVRQALLCDMPVGRDEMAVLRGQ